MEAFVLCDSKFGAGPIQAVIDYLIVEKRYRIVGAALIGKELPEGFALEVPFVSEADAAAAVRRAAETFSARAVVDATESDLTERFVWANEALQLGYEVHGADFRLWPPALKGADVPTVTFIGAGAAVGKTAAIVSFIGRLEERKNVAVIVLDLGGPCYPEVVDTDTPLTAERLLSLHRDGRRIDGDHYLLATATNVPAVGCSFAGTGLTGVPLNSLLGDAFVFAAEAGGDLAVVEGSGRAMPATAGALCFLVNVKTGPEVLRVFPFAYQLRRADAVIVTGFADEPPAEALEGLNAEVKAVNDKASFCYGKIVARAVGTPEFRDALVVTARPEDARDQLAEYWNGQLAGEVIASVGAELFPPAAATAKALRRAGGDAGLLLDMAASNIGEWLVWADSWDVPVRFTYESLELPEGVFEPLCEAARRTAS
jgi:predicted GTPase